VNENTVLPDYRQFDPVAWRQLCGVALQCADDIVAFSRASIALLQRAYPELGQFTLAPPEVPLAPMPPLPAPVGSSMRVAILGEIGRHKGSEVVAELAEFIRQHELPASVTVAGTIEARCDGKILRQTGRYSAGSVPALLREHAINIILFPSIVPETFSYTIREATASGLPVACFNLGAQAEWLADYPDGAVMEDTDAESVYRELAELFRRRYGTPPAHAARESQG
jgi:glycosyltransferase involved in cell wall biosynthesis